MKISRNVSRYINLFIILSVLGIIGYGIISIWCGFYYDDWPFAWIAHRLGPTEFIEAFKPYRPFLGPIFLITTSVLNEVPLLWHFFNLIIRILLSISTYWSLKKIWPDHQRSIFWISIFFLVNPGFNQQWVSMTHSNQAFIPHLAQIISFGLMIFIIKKPKSHFFLKLSALIFTFIGIFSTEYFLSLELLRPLLIWMVLEKNHPERKTRFIRLLKEYAPYLLILISNIVWLYYYQSSSAYSSYRISVLSQILNNPFEFFLSTFIDFLGSFSLAGFKIWANLFNLLMNFENSISSLIGVLVFFVTFLFLYLFLIRGKRSFWIHTDKDITQEGDHWPLQAMLLGGFGMLLGRLPSWSIGLPLSTSFPNDRLMMPLLFPSSIFIIGLIEYLIIQNYRKTILLMLICSLSVSHHFLIGNTYRRDWDMQNDFLQQLSWRAPGLDKGTLLLTHELPMQYVTDNSMSAAINWLYEPNNISKEISYMLAYTKARPGSALLPKIEPGTPVSYPYRTMRFKSNLDQSLVFYFPTNGCLRILDSVYTNKEFFPDAPYQLTDAIFISNLSVINPYEKSDLSRPFLVNLGQDNNWCYYFQKADLARQQQKWDEIVDLYEVAKSRGLRAENPNEYLVYIEALMHLGRFDQALMAFSDNALLENIPVDGACYTIERVSAGLSEKEKVPFSELLIEYNCQ